MRRRLRRKKRIFPIFLVGITLFIIVIGVSYGYLSTSLDIGGTISGNDINLDYTIAPNSHPYLDILSFKKNRWQESSLEKTQYEFYVNNKGKDTYDNFILTITFSFDVSTVDIWNYEYTLTNNTLVITNSNYKLNPNSKQYVNFIVGSSFYNNRILSIKFEVNEEKEDVDLDNFLVVFNKTGGWGNYTYQYDVEVTNKTGKKVNSWELRVTLPTNTTYVNGWNALYEVQGNVLIIKNDNHNGNLNNNKSTNLGLQLQTDIINFIPNDVRVSVWYK